MKMDIAQQRQQAHMLLDDLSQEKLLIIRNLLEVLVKNPPVSSLSQSLAMAELDGEELTPETVAALERAEASAERGPLLSHDRILQEFGFE